MTTIHITIPENPSGDMQPENLLHMTEMIIKDIDLALQTFAIGFDTAEMENAMSIEETLYTLMENAADLACTLMCSDEDEELEMDIETQYNILCEDLLALNLIRNPLDVTSHVFDVFDVNQPYETCTACSMKSNHVAYIETYATLMGNLTRLIRTISVKDALEGLLPAHDESIRNTLSKHPQLKHIQLKDTTLACHACEQPIAPTGEPILIMHP